MIRLFDSNDNYFKVIVTVKGDTRLTIECEPEKYGAFFVSTINNSSPENKQRFKEYWNLLNEKAYVTLKINEVSISQQNFDKINEPWTKFYLKLTKAPYYDLDNEIKNEVIKKYVINFVGMVLSLLDYEIIGFEEGNPIEKVSKAYERNPINRMLCLQEKGYTCSVCGMDFEEMYGSIGKGFINVHHSFPVSKMGKDHVVNVTNELFPVCPNCHAMLHRKNPPYTIEELKQILRRS